MRCAWASSAAPRDVEFPAFEVGENKILSLAALKASRCGVEHIVEKRGEKPFQEPRRFCERVDRRSSASASSKA